MTIGEFQSDMSNSFAGDNVIGSFLAVYLQFPWIKYNIFTDFEVWQKENVI